MRFEPFNINSGYEVGSQAHRLVMDKCGFLLRAWRDVPVYLVDKELMDIISPPEERKFLDPDCVGEFLDNYRLQNRELDLSDYSNNAFGHLQKEVDRFWKILSECGRRGLVETRAVYIQNISTHQIQAIRDYIIVRIPFRNQFGDQPFGTQIDINNLPGLDELSTMDKKLNYFYKQHSDIIPNGEAIFICMERLVEASQSVREQYGFKTTTTLAGVLEGIYACTLIHELVHAYNKIGSRYHEPWAKVIEESLAMAWAIRCFSDSSHYATLRIDVAENLLLEYKGYSFFDYFDQTALISIINAWRRGSARGALSVCLPDQIRNEATIVYPKSSAGLVWNDQIPPSIQKAIKTLAHNPETYWKLLAKELLLHANDK